MRVVILHVLIVLCCLLNIQSETWRKINSGIKDDGLNIPIIKLETYDDSINAFYELSENMVSIVNGIHQLDRKFNSKRVILGGCDNLNYEGEPSIPFISLRLIIPQDKALKGITTHFSNSIIIDKNIDIEFGEKLIAPSISRVIPTSPKEGIYLNDLPYPSSNYRISSLQRKCGVKILFVQLYPLKYLPKSKTLNLNRSLKIKVVLEDDRAGKNRDVTVRKGNFNIDKLRVENEYELKKYKSYRATSLGNIVDKREQYDYVIITNNEFKNANTDWSLNDLKAKREAQGLSVNIITVEDIYSKYSGIDKQEKIRNFIKDAYNKWGLKYLFLAGDSNIIPARILTPDRWPMGGAKEVYIPSDIYYQCLDGNYNVNNDNWWGEEKDGEGWGWIDILSELSVGRAPAENITEMSNFIYKTLFYEGANSKDNYLKNVLFLGEYMGFYQDSEYAKEHMEEIRNGSNLHNFITKGFDSDNTLTTNTMYEKDTPWIKSDIVNEINSNKYGVIQHLGHGMSKEVMHIGNSDADNLLNDKFPFIYTQACFCGKFTYDCVAEHLITSSRHGAWGGVFNGESGRINPVKTSGPSQRINRWFWDAYFSEGIEKVGDMNAYSHESCADISTLKLPDVLHCIYTTNLWADPYTSIKFKNLDSQLVITSPVKNQILKTGDLFEIKWNGLNDEFQVELLKGDQIVYLITEGALNNVSWEIPLDLDTSADYSVRLKSTQNSSLIFISDIFQIISGATDIEPIELDTLVESFDIVPNPVSLNEDFIKIVLPFNKMMNVSVLIVDNLGSVVCEKEFNSEVPNVFQWDLTNESGVRVAIGTYKLIIKGFDRREGEMIKYSTLIGVKK